VATAKLLGFAEHYIQVLMDMGKWRLLEKSAPKAPK